MQAETLFEKIKTLPPERIAELFVEPVLPKNGSYRLSDRPGLGLTLDERVFDQLLGA